jgi:aminomethyltransferase
MAMRCLTNNLRAEKDEIIRESGNERSAVGIRVQDKSEQQKRGENPGKPLDFNGQNKKDVDDFVGVESRKSEEQRCDQHAVGKIAAEEKCGDRCANHADEEIKCEPERAPRAFETFADEPQEPEGQHDPKTERLRNKYVSNQPPNFAVTNARRVEIKCGPETRIQPHQGPHQRGEPNHNADQSRNCEKTKASFEFIEPSHEVPHRKVHAFGFQGRGGSPNCPRPIEACYTVAQRGRVNRHYLCYVPRVIETSPKKTPLYDEHVRLGAKIVPFAGWLMPVQYTSIMEEHQAVRNSVGIFDISHMGQLIVEGANAREWLNKMLTNNIDKLDVGTGQYTFLLNERGGIIDDLIVYRIGEHKFLLVVNAARTDEDFAWLDGHLPAVEAAASAAKVRIHNRSAEFGGVAIQGPRIAELFHALFGKDAEPPARNHIIDFPFDQTTVSVARTGYTGEDGVEVFFGAADAVEFWNAALEKGRPFGIKPCGLGARDTLRLEMCYPLYGSDLSPERNPIEAGLGFFVDLTKPTFLGREVLLKTKEDGPREKLVPFRMKEKGPPPRPHYAVFQNGERIGEVTSGTLSPSLNWSVGMAYVSAAHAKIGTQIDIEIRGQKFPAVIEKKPLYKKS